MSYAEIKPEYYTMLQPQSPWHPGSEGWFHAPWPGWGENPNLVGPARLAVEGVGAYYPTHDTQPINGLGCGCSVARGVGDADPNAPATFPWQRLAIGAALVAATVYVFTRPKLLTTVMG